MKKIVGITGGIGAGKSVVQSILLAMGYDVYDCDSRAKILVDTNPTILKSIEQDICSNAVTSGSLNREVLANHVFKNPSALDKLNRLVHKEVINDFRLWHKDKERAFVESAILCTSGLDKEVDEIWEVVAPEKIRIERIMKRNPSLSEVQIKNRIESQRDECNNLSLFNTKKIINDGATPLLPRIESLLNP